MRQRPGDARGLGYLRHDQPRTTLAGGELQLRGDWPTLLLAAAVIFPRLALGLSGFETGVSVMPVVQGDPSDASAPRPEGRIRGTQRLLTAAAVLMSRMLLCTSIITTMLVPASAYHEGGPAAGRVLAYLTPVNGFHGRDCLRHHHHCDSVVRGRFRDGRPVEPGAALPAAPGDGSAVGGVLSAASPGALVDDRSGFSGLLQISVQRLESGEYQATVKGAVAVSNTIAYVSDLIDPISIFLGLTRRNSVEQAFQYLLWGEGETGILVYEILLRHWERTPEDDVRPYIFLMSE